MLERYRRNLNALSEGDMALLSARRVAVIGCGGLGGYAIEYLCRLGIGEIVAVDGDRFEESNLNRQILADSGSIGDYKAERAAARASLVNPLVRVSAVTARLDGRNGREILAGVHIVIDAVDSIPARLMLQGVAEELGIPLVHGAVAGWYAQATTIYPGDRSLDRVYGRRSGDAGRERGIEAQLGNLAFGPAAVAALQAAEAIKVLTGKGTGLRKKLLILDLLENEFEILDLEQRHG